MTHEEIQKVLQQPFTWVVPDDKMVVIQYDAEKKTAGGIFIPDTAQEKPHKGIIIALGPDILLNEEGLKKRGVQYRVGDLCVYGKYAGTEINIDIGECTQVPVVLMRITDYMIGQKFMDRSKGPQ